MFGVSRRSCLTMMSEEELSPDAGGVIRSSRDLRLCKREDLGADRRSCSSAGRDELVALPWQSLIGGRTCRWDVQLRFRS